MAEDDISRKPITEKKAETGDHVVGRKDQAIRAEIEAEPNISARQIAEKLQARGIEVSMSHIYRQLSNFTRRTEKSPGNWAGTNIGMPAPAGFSVPDAKAYLDSPKEYGGSERTKETLAAIEEVGDALEGRGTSQSRTGSTPQRTSRSRDSKMSHH